MRTLLVFAVAIALLMIAPAAFAQRHSARSDKSVVSQTVRATASRLANAWVDTASAQTLDQLSNRSIAFAGMIPNVVVVLDGHRMSATQVLKDSALTILGSHTTAEDAEATRNIVYALTEIANGRASKGR